MRRSLNRIPVLPEEGGPELQTHTIRSCRFVHLRRSRGTAFCRCGTSGNSQRGESSIGIHADAVSIRKIEWARPRHWTQPAPLLEQTRPPRELDDVLSTFLARRFGRSGEVNCSSLTKPERASFDIADRHELQGVLATGAVSVHSGRKGSAASKPELWPDSVESSGQTMESSSWGVRHSKTDSRFSFTATRTQTPCV